ncbi:MAG: hypothetical protein HQM13_09480 [SAR324 cluster bacterium]|nr:hypothetical protein [SAR324 cluster bacterium]
MLLANFAYAAAIPLPSFVENFCKNQGLNICAGEQKPDTQKEQKAKEQPLTENEKLVLKRLREKNQLLIAKEKALNRREGQLKTLEGDLQGQIARLEKLQQEIEKDIDTKKKQDSDQLLLTVKFYEKMEPAKAAKSIEQLNTKIAVQILLNIKDKQASAVLAEMAPEKSARLVEEIARKK